MFDNGLADAGNERRGTAGAVEGQRLFDPIILITAYPEECIRRRVLSAGAVGFLTKPFMEEALVGCLDNAFKSIGLNGYIQ